MITDSLYFHKLGTSKSADKLIYLEKDKQFNLSFSLSRTKRYLFLQVSKTETNETWFLDLNQESMNLKCFLKRKNKHLYYIDDSPDKFFILSNRKNRKNFALYQTNISKISQVNWKSIIAHKKNELIEDFLVFQDFIILETRKKGISCLIQIDRKNKKKFYVEFNGNVHTVSLSNNNDYKARYFSFIYSSLKSPPAVYSQDLYTKKG